MQERELGKATTPMQLVTNIPGTIDTIESLKRMTFPSMAVAFERLYNFCAAKHVGLVVRESGKKSGMTIWCGDKLAGQCPWRASIRADRRARGTIQPDISMHDGDSLEESPNSQPGTPNNGGGGGDEPMYWRIFRIDHDSKHCHALTEERYIQRMQRCVVGRRVLFSGVEVQRVH